MKPCVSKSSSDEIMRFLTIRFSIGASSTDLSPESFLSASNWSALDALKSGVVPFRDDSMKV